MLEDKLDGKIEDDDKEMILNAIQDGLDWLEDNENAEKEDYEEKQKKIEKITNPIMSIPRCRWRCWRG